MLISIDHGNKQIKTIHHEPFTSGLQESETRPFGDEVVKYQGKYYTLTDQRIPYHRDKTEDERFFILTLFAIAYEVEAVGGHTPEVMRVQLAVGLPPAHYSALHKTFTQYFSGRGVVQFEFKGRAYAIYIDQAVCFPQSYAAAVTMLKSLQDCPKALVVDIGGFTADYLQIKDGAGDLTVCDSLENGVILFYNKVKSRVSAELDLLLEESEIDAILTGRTENVHPRVVELVERQAQEFINDLLSTLRERGLELKSGKVVFVGGGSILLRRQIEASGKVGTAIFVEDICANAKGYEYLYRIVQAGR
jgi:plasmid segregation protein ParM